MKRWMVLGVMLLSGMSMVAAEEPLTDAGVLNDPPQAVSLVQQVLAKLDPSYETVWDVYNGDFYQGISGALYMFEANNIHLGSLRLGASTGMAIYSGASLDVPGLTKWLLPDVVTTAVSPTPLDTVWSVIGKYARVGVVGGYSWDHHDPVLGITAGAAVSF